jgi:hypothetical protein
VGYDAYLPLASGMQRKIKQLPVLEAQRIDDIVYHIENTKQKVVARMDVLESERLANIQKGNKTIHRETQAMRYQLHGIGRSISDVSQEVNHGFKEIEFQLQTAGEGMQSSLEASMSRGLDHLRSEMELQLDELRRHIPEMVQTALYRFVAEMSHSRGMLKLLRFG